MVAARWVGWIWSSEAWRGGGEVDGCAAECLRLRDDGRRVCEQVVWNAPISASKRESHVLVRGSDVSNERLGSIGSEVTR